MVTSFGLLGDTTNPTVTSVVSQTGSKTYTVPSDGWYSLRAEAANTGGNGGPSITWTGGYKLGNSNYADTNTAVQDTFFFSGLGAVRDEQSAGDPGDISCTCYFYADDVITLTVPSPGTHLVRVYQINV